MSHSSLAQSLPRWWYRRGLSLQLWPLLPFSWLFRLVVAARCRLYRLGVLKSIRLAVPVIVVGNLTVGGSGKTPLVIWLVQRLRAQGFHPGIISRGYGGVEGQVRVAKADSQAAEVGDEPLLLARRCNVPVFVGRDRVAAGAALLARQLALDEPLSASLVEEGVNFAYEGAALAGQFFVAAGRSQEGSAVSGVDEPFVFHNV